MNLRLDGSHRDAWQIWHTGWPGGSGFVAAGTVVAAGAPFFGPIRNRSRRKKRAAPTVVGGEQIWWLFGSRVEGAGQASAS